MNSASPTAPPSRPPALKRLLMYVGALVLVPMVAFFLGYARFNSTECSGPDSGDCDLGGLAGLMWAGVALIVVLFAVAVAEFVIAQKRRR